MLSTGLFDLNPNKVGQINNVVTDASKFGTQIEHWDGVDVNVVGRYSSFFFSGGVAAGRRLTDNCEVRAKLPEIAISGGFQPVTNPFCRTAEPMLTSIKGTASYNLPWYGIRLSGTLQSVPGPVIAANNTYTSALGGRAFSGGSATVNLVEPGTLYRRSTEPGGPAVHEDPETGTAGTIDLDIDVYNAFNSDAILSQQDAYSFADVAERDGASSSRGSSSSR